MPKQEGKGSRLDMVGNEEQLSVAIEGQEKGMESESPAGIRIQTQMVRVQAKMRAWKQTKGNDDKELAGL